MKSGTLLLSTILICVFAPGELFNYSFFLYYAMYGSTQAHKYKKAKIHLKYKKGINTNIKAHSSAR